MKKVIKQGTSLLVLVLSLLGASRLVHADDEDGLKMLYKVGDGLSIGDGDNKFHIQGRFQGRFTFTKPEGPAGSTDSFSISRGEIRIDGFTAHQALKFGFEMNLATRNPTTTATVCSSSGTAVAPCPAGTAAAVTSASTTGLATLNDYYVDWTPQNEIGIQVGQFKVPFLMQQLTSITKQQFIDRSLLSGTASSASFDLGRDLGATVHGALFNKKFNYSVFVMNGDGANSVNRNSKFLMAGTRIEVPILGDYKNSETDVEFSEKHNLGFGVAYAFNDTNSALQSGTIAAFSKTSHATMDIGYKYRGFSLQNALVLSRAHEGTHLSNWGYNTQVGYFVIPKLFEVAVRAGGMIFSKAATTPVANQFEYALGINYFPFMKGHGIKFQTDYAILKGVRGFGLEDHRIRTAMNLIF